MRVCVFVSMYGTLVATQYLSNKMHAIPLKMPILRMKMHSSHFSIEKRIIRFSRIWFLLKLNKIHFSRKKKKKTNSQSKIASNIWMLLSLWWFCHRFRRTTSQHPIFTNDALGGFSMENCYGFFFAANLNGFSNISNKKQPTKHITTIINPLAFCH